METELRLGLPGDGESAKSNGSKRGFHEAVELKLNFSSMESGKEGGGREKSEKRNPAVSLPSSDPVKPPLKTQVVGWPPVRLFRKNMAVQKNGGSGEGEKNGGNTASFVKVSMDGAPYLRKVDLRVYKSYQELSFALSNMFSSLTFDGTKDFKNDRKLTDLLHNSEYVLTYEDKDGDWMLVGDVPWKMFVDSCQRLRIMKGSDAIGIDKL